jgi:hypothetical protein
MHMQTLVMWIALAITFAIPLYMWRRRRDILGGLQAFVGARGFVKRDISPVAALALPNPPDGFHFSAGYAGSEQGVPLTLLILKRSEAVNVQGVSMQNQTIYIGVHVPQGSIGNAFVADWQRKAQNRRDYVVHVSQPAEGGVLIVWKGSPSRANVQARLAAVAATVQGHRGDATAAHDS